jgi:hypothetical protein
MSKFKPFSKTKTKMDYINNSFVSEKIGSNPFTGKPAIVGEEFDMCHERRHGIEVYVLPTKKDGEVVWKWKATQYGAKLTSKGYKFSNYSRQWQDGFTNTFEEGLQIVTDLYAKWMDERPTA